MAVLSETVVQAQQVIFDAAHLQKLCRNLLCRLLPCLALWGDQFQMQRQQQSALSTVAHLTLFQQLQQLLVGNGAGPGPVQQGC